MKPAAGIWYTTSRNRAIRVAIKHGVNVVELRSCRFIFREDQHRDPWGHRTNVLHTGPPRHYPVCLSISTDHLMNAHCCQRTDSGFVDVHVTSRLFLSQIKYSKAKMKCYFHIVENLTGAIIRIPLNMPFVVL